MMFILVLIASYIIGIIGWSIILIRCSDIETYDELREELCDSLAFVPVTNIIFLIGLIIIGTIISVVQLIYEYSGIEKLWNNIKNKKLPFKN